MQSILTFLQGQGALGVVLGFMVLSLVIKDLAEIMKVLGKSLPPGFSTVANAIGNVLHFINGNPGIFGQAAADAAGNAVPVPAPVPPAGPSA